MSQPPRLSKGVQDAAAAAEARAATRVNPFAHLIKGGKEKRLQRETVEAWKSVVEREKQRKRRSDPKVWLQRARGRLSARNELRERLAREAEEQHQRRLIEDPRYRLRYQMNHIHKYGDTLQDVMRKIGIIRETFTLVIEQGIEDIDAIYHDFMGDIQRFIGHMQELLSSRSGVIFTGIQVREIKELLDMVADNSGGRIQPIAIELVGPDQEAGRLAAERKLAAVDEARVRAIHVRLLDLGFGHTNDMVIRQLCAEFDDDDDIIARYLSMNEILDEDEYDVPDVLAADGAVGGAAVGYDERVDQVRDTLQGFGYAPNVDGIRQLCNDHQGATTDFIVQRYLERYGGKKRRRHKRDKRKTRKHKKTQKKHKRNMRKHKTHRK
jgi:hypothetical protein